MASWAKGNAVGFEARGLAASNSESVLPTARHRCDIS